MHNDSDPQQDGPPLPEELLARFDAPDAAAQRREWLAAGAGRDAELLWAQRLWRLTAPPLDHPSWPDLRERIERAEAELSPAKATPNARARGRLWWSLARAAAVLLLGFALGRFAPGLVRGAPLTGRTVVAVPAGATASLRLPGGVLAHLNAASTLSYGAGAGTDVELEGEGYFEVPHDPSRRFSVRTAAGVVRDLGTAFDVRARDQSVQVAVAEGSVRLEAAGQAVTVAAGHRSSADAGRPPLPPVAADVRAARAWIDGRLVFIDAPLADVAAEMTRHFGVPFHVRPLLTSRRITATIRTRSSAEAASAICAALALRCRQQDAGWLFDAAS